MPLSINPVGWLHILVAPVNPDMRVETASKLSSLGKINCRLTLSKKAMLALNGTFRINNLDKEDILFVSKVLLI